MRSVADDLRIETHRRSLEASAAQRIDRALALGDEDARLFAAVRGLTSADARRLIARTRQTGRPPSCAGVQRP